MVHTLWIAIGHSEMHWAEEITKSVVDNFQDVFVRSHTAYHWMRYDVWLTGIPAYQSYGC